jgi:hypothetical protein
VVQEPDQVAPGLADFGRVWTGNALAEIGEEPGR